VIQFSRGDLSLAASSLDFRIVTQGLPRELQTGSPCWGVCRILAPRLAERHTPFAVRLRRLIRESLNVSGAPCCGVYAVPPPRFPVAHMPDRHSDRWRLSALIADVRLPVGLIHQLPSAAIESLSPRQARTIGIVQRIHHQHRLLRAQAYPAEDRQGLPPRGAGLKWFRGPFDGRLSRVDLRKSRARRRVRHQR
jgi:hypothetical protein